MTSWEKFYDDKLKLIANCQSILDVGGGIKFGKYLEKYKNLFGDNEYIVLDKEPKYKPDVIGDIHDLPFEDERFAAVHCNAVLEHVENPIKAVAEMHRVLKPGGQVLVYVPFLYPYHAEKGVYKDFYRYTKDGLGYLFRNFSNVEINPVRGFFETWLYFLPKVNKILAPRLGRFLDKLVKQSGNQASGYQVYAVK